MDVVAEGFSSRHLLLVISANPVKVFKCFTKLNRSLWLLPPSRALIFSLWVAKVLALKLEVSSVDGHKIKRNQTVSCSRAGTNISHIKGHLAVKLEQLRYYTTWTFLVSR